MVSNPINKHVYLSPYWLLIIHCFGFINFILELKTLVVPCSKHVHYVFLNNSFAIHQVCTLCLSMILTLWNKPIDQTFNDSNFTLPNRNLLDFKLKCTTLLQWMCTKSQRLVNNHYRVFQWRPTPWTQSLMFKVCIALNMLLALSFF